MTVVQAFAGGLIDQWSEVVTADGFDEHTVVFGEVGLGGEIRSVTHSDRRVSEAKKLGFKKAIAPKSSSKNSFIAGVTELRQALVDYVT